MERDLERILVTREEIAARVEELARDISADLERLNHAEGGEVVIVAVLTGSIIFIADLIRRLPQKLRISVITVSSYPGRTTQPQGATLRGSLPDELSGKHVLIVDDILDSGRTLALLRSEIEQRRPRSVRTCVLLRKEKVREPECPCEYVGFDIPDAFVVGYGLDHDDYYRNLPDIGVLRVEALKEK